MFERLFERIDVVDALTDKGPFSEQVLIHIRNGAGVRVDARFTSVESRVPRSVGAGQADGHARLQDAIAFHDSLRAGIVPWTIQGVSHRRHELPRGITRQLRIRVERDDVLDGGQYVRL